jgi:hypothetical protein
MTPKTILMAGQKAAIVGARVLPKHIVGHIGMTHMTKPD